MPKQYLYDFPKRKKIDTAPLINKKFGHLFVVMKPNDPKTSLLSCRCDCGSTSLVRAYDLIRGTRTACGKTCPYTNVNKRKKKK